MTQRRPPPTFRRDARFTLLETLVALALLGLLTVFLVDGLRLGSRYLQTAISRAEPADAIGTVQDLLHRMLAETYPALSYSDAGPQPVFDGQPDRLIFTTVIPLQLGTSGYFRVALSLAGGRLLIRWQPERGPYNLLDHVASLHLRDFGAASSRELPASRSGVRFAPR